MILTLKNWGQIAANTIGRYLKDQSGRMSFGQQQQQQSQDRTYQVKNLPLNGKLRTAIDGILLGEGDFKILENMRYGELSPKSVVGMTKINTSVINATYLKPRSGFHYRKSQPSESHFLIQAWNTGLTAAVVYQNTTAIPTAGNFSATAVWTDTASSEVGRFSDAPDMCMIYANGKDTCVWGGAEYRVAAFIVSDLTDTISFDYTDQVNNTLTDANNIATLTNAASGGGGAGIDANTLLMLHCDGDNDGITFTDSSLTTPHNVTPTNCVTKTATKKFGTASAYFDGTGDYLSIPDNADFDLSNAGCGSTWTFDCWVNTAWGGGAISIINLYYHQTDADNYMQIYLSKDILNRYAAHIKIVAATTVVVQVDSSTLGKINSAWHHLEFVESVDAWYIFHNGTLVGTGTDTSRAANYTGANVYIGADAAGANPYKGYIDEIRLSNTARHIANFTPPTVAYSSTTAVSYTLISSTRPIQGIKWYVQTANTSTAAAAVSYWGDNWTAVSSLTDNTSTGGKSMAATGTMTFTSTVGYAHPRSFHDIYAYWYLVTFTGLDTGTQVYYVTLDAPMQQIVDLWDGIPRSPAQVYKYTTSYSDETTHVLVQDYVTSDTTTYMDVSSLATSTQYILVGFAERMAGMRFIFGNGVTNSTNCIMSLSAWDGDAYETVGAINDGTSADDASFTRDGTVTWDALDESEEFRTSVSGGELWYYYKIEFSATLDASVYVDQITGIPAQKNIRAHEFPVMWQDRVWLLNETSWRKNSALCSSAGTVCVFNGSDSMRLTFGSSDKIRGGATQFTRFGGSLYDNLVVFKYSEVWLVDGTGPYDYRTFKIADNYGLVAPGTLRSCDMGYEIVPGLLKHVLIWQSEGAVVMFDGNAISPISGDIENYFDRSKTECIPDAMREKSEAFYDFSNYEYHFLFASGAAQTTLNKEFVYDLRRKKWFEIDRGTGKYLQIGVPTRSTTGNSYVYGGIDTGYMERLEYGSTFDGTAIVATYQTGDIAFAGWTHETVIRAVRHIAKSKTSETGTVTMTHYGNAITTSTETATFSIVDSTHDIAVPIKSMGWNGIWHSLKCSITTSTAYEPFGIAVYYPVTREALK